MPRVNPEIIAWARETAGLTQEEAAKKLGFRDSRVSSAAEKLAAVEHGVKEPSRSQLLRMAGQYHRPLLTFYLSRPPKQSELGTDYRSMRDEPPAPDAALLNALVRDIRARQSMVRAVLEDEDEAELLPFVGSHWLEDGQTTVLQSLQTLLGIDSTAYRAERNASDAFNLLRRSVEKEGVFVLLKGDLGNYVTAIDTTVFRGFSIADNVAPFIVINDQDARPAWSFTLLHEMVHLFLGQTGISGEYRDNEVEQFCDDVAGEFLLPAELLYGLAPDNVSYYQDISDQVSALANESNVSRTMVAYKAYRSHLITHDIFRRLSTAFREEWRTERDRARARAREQEKESGPNYYTVRRHRLGNRLLGLVEHMMSADSLSTSKAARILGVRPRQVQPLLGIGSSL